MRYFKAVLAGIVWVLIVCAFIVAIHLAAAALYILNSPDGAWIITGGMFAAVVFIFGYISQLGSKDE